MTQQLRVRRGLPRSPGGPSWPPDRAVPPTDMPAGNPTVTTPTSPTPTLVSEPSAPTAPRPVPGRGLPRIRGGEPWPPIHPGPLVAAIQPGSREKATQARAFPGSPAAVFAIGTIRTRRGLPRTVGGEPWPPDRPAPTPAWAASDDSHPVHGGAAAESMTLDPTADPAPPTTASPGPAAASVGGRPTARPGHSEPPAARPEPKRYRGRTAHQWLLRALVGAGGLVAVALLVVLLTRWFLSLAAMREFLDTYPGEYHLPDWAPVGLPAWLGWQHFFNSFFMLLIIRTGIQVRTEKRPAAYWTARWAKDPKRRISLTLWLHQALDLLWIDNGLVFFVLLFATDQWVRIVPTSWEVFPNAISAALQYLSMDWPTENGWVNYNSLQQLAYFTTVFIAAPLAAASGVRMSGLWPKNNATLNRIYPIELARAIHFPVMLYFCAFIVVHVALVLATGALRNLNHMYAAQDTMNWTGLWIFIATIVIMAAGWVAARPLIVGPIAGLFGTVGR